MAGPRNIVPITPSPITQILGPGLQYHGGDVIGSVQVQPIFWGQAWQSNPNSQLITQINSFFDRNLQSALMDMLGEYSTPSTRIQRGSRLPSVSITPSTTADPPAAIGDAQIQTTLQNWIAPPNAVPAPTANTLYFIYLPPGTTVTAVFNNTTFTSCAAAPNSICGYHSSIPSKKIFYAVIPFDISSCATCQFYGGTALARLTAVSSHELCESITNPDGQGWFDPNTLNEIGDICAPPPAGQGGVFNIGNDIVQEVWSNNRCGCLGSNANPLVPSAGFSNGIPMNGTDSTTHGVAVCSFLQHLFVFWKSNDPSNSILFSASPDGRFFPPGKRISPNDATPAAPACCVFNDQIFVFWKANDPSDSIYSSASPSGQDGSWSHIGRRLHRDARNARSNQARQKATELEAGFAFCRRPQPGGSRRDHPT